MGLNMKSLGMKFAAAAALGVFALHADVVETDGRIVRELAVQKAVDAPKGAAAPVAVPWLALSFKSSRPEMTDGNPETFVRFEDDLRSVMPRRSPTPGIRRASPLPARVQFKSEQPAVVRACRIVWRDCGVKGRQESGVGPFRYRIEYRAGDVWKTLVDASDNKSDLPADYRETPRVETKELRLTVLGAPEGVIPGIAEFTAFGETAEKK